MYALDQFTQFDVSTWGVSGGGEWRILPEARSRFARPRAASFSFAKLLKATLAALVVSSPAYAERVGTIEKVGRSTNAELVAVPTKSSSDRVTPLLAADSSATSVASSYGSWGMTFSSPVAAAAISIGAQGTSQADASSEAATTTMINPDRYSIQLSRVAQTFLGARGVERLRLFARTAPGWDAGTGASLRIESLRELDEFVQQLGRRASNPSVFMSHAGNATLSWVSAKLGLIELEFRHEGVSYYIERDDEEDEVSGEAWGRLRKRLVIDAFRA